MNIDLRFIQDSKLASVVKGYFSLNDISLPNGSYTVIPGLIDVHVHFREPGFFYKESIKTGSMASARGGYTSVCTMPNLKPVPDSVENLKQQLDIIDKDAVIKVYPYGAITIGEQGEQLADLKVLGNYVLGFSDDGKGVQSDDMMLLAMQTAKDLNLPIVAHCEVNSLLNGGYIHDGDYAKEHNHKGICSRSEWEQIARDIELVKKTGVKYHVCHISTKESVEIIRQAKKDGVDVTCETAPHYLILCDKDLKEDGSYKMNPPLRGEDDKKALIEGVLDGTIDMIATDHAPHSLEEKSKGLSGSVFGIVGIETAFQLMYTYFVKTGKMSMDFLLDLLVYNARKRFNIPQDNGFSVWDLDKDYIIDANDFLSKGKSTPFIGTKVYGENYLTVVDGKIAYKK